MRTSLSHLLFEDTTDTAIEEAMAIGAGGASMASSGQIAGGSMLPLGMKPGEKVKKRKRGSVISASPAVHNPDALALQEMPHVEYSDYEPKDFKVETMPLSKKEKVMIMRAFRDRGVLCHGPDGDWLICTLDNVRKATDSEIADDSIPHLDVSLESEHKDEELFEYTLDKSDRGMKNLWSGLSDVSGEDEPVKTDSENLYGIKVRKD
jgi:hypothetical protein